MTIQEALLAYLKTHVDCAALIALVATRIYDQYWPTDREPTFPLITVSQVSGGRHHNIDVAYPRFQFSCWAETKSMARAVADTLRNVLQRYKGVMGGIEIPQIVYENDLDFYDAESKLYHIPVDFKIIYRGE